jgi:tetratricopeptide (TPR) repeat protein
VGIILKDQGKLEEAIEAYKKALLINPDYIGCRFNLANCLKTTGKLEEAIEAYDRIKNSPDSVALALECLYALKKFDDFNRRLDDINSKDQNNIRVAAISAFAAHQLKQNDIFTFCKDPLDMVHKSSIKNYLPNSDAFISNFLAELNSTNQTWEPTGQTTKGGFQTGSKLFSAATSNTILLQDILKKELMVFKEKFKNKANVLIKNWPDEIKFAAWYVRLLKGGHQGSHIHPKGWVSGVLYLKTIVDPVANEGAIKFGLHGYDYPISDKELPSKVYQPVDGDLVLFPSSLFHETIPVRQSVERCVVAFDLLP